LKFIILHQIFDWFNSIGGKNLVQEGSKDVCDLWQLLCQMEAFSLGLRQCIYFL
jgi:hypothetical protein